MLGNDAHSAMVQGWPEYIFVVPEMFHGKKSYLKS